MLAIALSLAQPHSQTISAQASITPQEIINLTNNERLDGGKLALSESPLLTRAAQAKLAHMFEHNYWDHIAPDGTPPWRFINDTGYSYSHAGENLARDFQSSQEVIDGWVASQPHRENLLNNNYSEIGIAVGSGILNGRQTILIVAMYAKPATGLLQGQFFNNSRLRLSLESLSLFWPFSSKNPLVIGALILIGFVAVYYLLKYLKSRLAGIPNSRSLFIFGLLLLIMSLIVIFRWG